MELLELMKLDMANFAIEQIRPHIQQQSVHYERKKFQEFLETQSSKEKVNKKIFFRIKMALTAIFLILP